MPLGVCVPQVENHCSRPLLLASYIGIFDPYLHNVWKGQLIDDNGEKIEEGVCSLKQFTNGREGVEIQHGLYFGEEITGKVSGKIHLTNGKTYQGEFNIKIYHFNPTEGTLYTFDGRIIQEGKWENGKFVG